MGGFSAPRLKVNLTLSVNRLKMLQQKKSSQNAVYRREIATLMENQKIESARIRVEHVIREDDNIESLEILEICCETLLARFGVLDQMKELDPSISEAVHTICYAAPKVDAAELMVVRDQLMLKYGKIFEAERQSAQKAGKPGLPYHVNERLLRKLRPDPPKPILVNQYLKEIATHFNVEWIGAASDELPVRLKKHQLTQASVHLLLC